MGKPKDNRQKLEQDIPDGLEAQESRNCMKRKANKQTVHCEDN